MVSHLIINSPSATTCTSTEILLFQTVDELISTLMGMGFELGDIQQGIQLGKLTAEQVIEW